MLVGIIVAWVLLGLVALYAHLKNPATHREAVRQGWQTSKFLLVRLPIAIVAISLLVTLVPESFIAEKLGGAAGLEGILYGSVLGAFLPGGPAIAFPVVIVLMDAGAGGGPLVALLTAWTVLAVHRLLLFEIPFMGARFALLRIASTFFLPPFAGLAGGWIMG